MVVKASGLRHVSKVGFWVTKRPIGKVLGGKKSPMVKWLGGQKRPMAKICSNKSYLLWQLSLMEIERLSKFVVNLTVIIFLDVTGFFSKKHKYFKAYGQSNKSR